jgi:hypothetical protein
MTPSDISNFARSKYNAVSDSFFTDAEIYQYIYQACLELAAECNILETIYSTTSVTGQQSYAFPTQTRIIKRITYANVGGGSVKLEPITFREDDALTLVNVASTTQGFPQFYTQFNYSIYLRPIPDATGSTITIYSFNEPQPVTATSVIEVPSLFHMDLCDFVVKEMYAKDKDPDMLAYFDARWGQAKLRIKRWVQKRKRGDAFTIVQNEDNLAVTLTGPV